MYSRLSRNAETVVSDKEALFASAGGMAGSKRLEELGAAARQATRRARRWSWTILEVNFTLSSYPIKKAVQKHRFISRIQLPESHG